MGQFESPEPRSQLQIGAIALLVISLAAAGAGAGFAFDATRGFLDPQVTSGSTTEEQIRKGMELRQQVARRGSALGGAVGGALIIGVFGFTLGWHSRAAFQVGAGLVGGAVSGTALGAVGGYLTQEISEFSISNSVSSMTTYFFISGTYWLCLGIAAALTTLIAGPKETPKGTRMVGPMLGGAMAAVLTPILATIAFPVDFKGRIPPQETEECYFVGAVAAAFLAMGSGVGLLKTDHR